MFSSVSGVIMVILRSEVVTCETIIAAQICSTIILVIFKAQVQYGTH